MKILLIVWARPNFMKVAPIISEIKKNKAIEYKLIHTWQHFDKNMSDSFFEDLWLPYPDINLNIHGWSVSEQIWRVMIEFDKILQDEKPDYVLVVWDVNSTVACAITAKQNWIKVIHVESWLRSFDQKMPEEINRILTDRISDFLFITENSWIVNLTNEWIIHWVHLVWHVMIDCLIQNLSKIDSKNTITEFWLEKWNYCLITLHRPSNVDTKEDLEKYLTYFNKIAQKITLFLPLHPRTKNNIEKFGLSDYLHNDRIVVTWPLWYTDFIHLVKNSKFVLTDSWWIQEESTYLQIPCLTMRQNTERPVTCEIGSNTLVWDDFDAIDWYIDTILAWTYKQSQIPPLRDGKAAERIVAILLEDYAASWK